MHHYQNISYLVDAFNRKQLTVHLVLFFRMNITQLNDIITKLTMQQHIHSLGLSSDGKIAQISSSGYNTDAP